MNADVACVVDDADGEAREADEDGRVVVADAAAAVAVGGAGAAAVGGVGGDEPLLVGVESREARP